MTRSLQWEHVYCVHVSADENCYNLRKSKLVEVKWHPVVEGSLTDYDTQAISKL